MEKFFTQVAIEPPGIKISREDPVWTVGSCFSDEIGRRMAEGGFKVRPNPLGTLFNPASICRQLKRVAEGVPYAPGDLYLHNGLWHSHDFHTSFSSPDCVGALAAMNGAISSLHDALPSLRYLILTLGSARAFICRDTGCVVANCHKLPADRFEVTDLSTDTIAGDLSATLRLLKTAAPQMEVIITVSPIRHKAYGLHADKLSKARLLLAADTICSRGEAVYFPSYEIMTDELRDYRFYAADMVHPSETAAEHIFGRFAETFFTPATINDAAHSRKESRRLRHRETSG